jgi:hypothetical protein
MTHNKDSDISAGHRAVMDELRTLMNAVVRLFEKRVSYDKAEKIADSLTSIRMLLLTWEELERRNMMASTTAEEVRKLRERALELEGMVKEMRNRLEREQRELGMVGKRTAKE